MNICVYGASSDDIAPVYMEQVYTLGQKLAAHGHELVFGGGAHGLMGAVARGVDSVGGRIIGIIPRFLDKGDILYRHCTEVIYTDTLRQRKQKMEELADAFLMVPGGIGTYEEFFEVLTLKQLGQHNKPIAVLNLENYFDPLQALMEHTEEAGFMRADFFTSVDIYVVCATAAEVLDYFEYYDRGAISLKGLKNL